MDMEIPQYCRRCGTMLVDGACPTCPAQASASAPHPPRPAPAATLTAIAPSAPAAHHAPAQPEPHHQWFSSAPSPPVAMRGKGSRYARMWNWGAALLCPLWLMNHGRIGRAVVFLVLCIVPLGWVFALGMAIAYGIKGNRVASMSRDFVDDAQFVAVQNAWRNFGFGAALVAVLLVLVGFANVMFAPQHAS
jgi:hypothetical protein